MLSRHAFLLKYCGYLSLILTVFFVVPATLNASTSDGTIDPLHKTARVCHDVGCVTGISSITPGILNFAPTVTNPSDVVHIADTGLTGRIWGNELGWITLNPTGEGVMVDPTTGLILGRGWSQVAGWVNFAPSGQAVYINSNGEFNGFAWAGGPMGGWIQFDCTVVNACVKTDWRALPFRTTTNPPPTSPSGGHGSVLIPVTTGITFSGSAFPQAHVFLLQDGQRIADTITTNTTFSFSVKNLHAGNYVFGIYAEDTTGARTGLFSLPVAVTTGQTGTVASITIPPTLRVSKNAITAGQYITVSGFGLPNSDLVIVRGDTQEKLFQVHTDATGKYTATLNTHGFDVGTIPLVSQAVSAGDSILSSLPASFQILRNIFPHFFFTQGQPTCAALKGDLNGDCRVNLIDFTILSEWRHHPLSDTIKKRELERLNGDGVIDMRDFSIIASHWTG